MFKGNIARTVRIVVVLSVIHYTAILVLINTFCRADFALIAYLFLAIAMFAIQRLAKIALADTI